VAGIQNGELHRSSILEDGKLSPKRVSAQLEAATGNMLKTRISGGSHVVKSS
jgi:hypothetical protein